MSRKPNNTNSYTDRNADLFNGNGNTGSTYRSDQLKYKPGSNPNSNAKPSSTTPLDDKKSKLPTGPKGMIGDELQPASSSSRYYPANNQSNRYNPPPGNHNDYYYTNEDYYYNEYYGNEHQMYQYPQHQHQHPHPHPQYPPQGRRPGAKKGPNKLQNERKNDMDNEDEDLDDVFSRLSNKKRKAGTNINNQNKQKSAKQQKQQPSVFNYMVKCKVSGSIHERIQQVGEGTYGKVYKAKNVITNELVALKKLRLEAEREGFPITSHREIGLLQSFDHENIVGLSEIMVERNQVFMVFPYMNHDLSGILQQSQIQISYSEKKNIFLQLLKGVEYLHAKRVIHRDIKGSNILIDNNGVLKITDFGLARKMKNINEKLISPNYTNRVITLWYRPPEILLGSIDYGREVDVWGVGCILLELFTRRAIFQGTNEIDQLLKVYDIMGTITTEDWPNAYKLPWFEILRPSFKSESKFSEKFGALLTPDCYSLAIELLRMNPEKRITATQALDHPYFKEDPQPSPLLFLKSVKGEWHEFEAKQKRKQLQKMQQQQQQLSHQQQQVQ